MGNREAVNPRSTGPILSRCDSSDYVRSRWPSLPPHIRESIVSLVDASCRLADDAIPFSPSSQAEGAGKHHEEAPDG